MQEVTLHLLCYITGQQTAYIAGRGTLQEEVARFKSASGSYYYVHNRGATQTYIIVVMAGQLCLVTHLLSHLCLENLTDLNASEEDSTCAFCLLLPGKILYLSPLLAMKKFRKRGNKEGAIGSFYKLESEGLGKVLEVRGARGTSTVSLTFASNT